MADEQPNIESNMSSFDTAIDPVSSALQELCNAVASEELPDDFLRILEEIDAKTAAASLNSSQ